MTGSSPTGSQILQAVGCAEAGVYFAAHPEAAKKATGDYRQFKDVTFHGDEVTLLLSAKAPAAKASSGRRMNTVSNQRLPFIFVVEDNEYAISVPVEAQMPGGNISRLVSGFPNFHFEEVDGTDLVGNLCGFRPHCRLLSRRQRARASSMPM